MPKPDKYSNKSINLFLYIGKKILFNWDIN